MFQLWKWLLGVPLIPEFPVWLLAHAYFCQVHTTFHVSMLRRAYNNGAGVRRPPITWPSVMYLTCEDVDSQVLVVSCIRMPDH